MSQIQPANISCMLCTDNDTLSMIFCKSCKRGFHSAHPEVGEITNSDAFVCPICIAKLAAEARVIQLLRTRNALLTNSPTITAPHVARISSVPVVQHIITPTRQRAFNFSSDFDPVVEQDNAAVELRRLRYEQLQRKDIEIAELKAQIYANQRFESNLNHIAAAAPVTSTVAVPVTLTPPALHVENVQGYHTSIELAPSGQFPVVQGHSKEFGRYEIVQQENKDFVTRTSGIFCNRPDQVIRSQLETLTRDVDRVGIGNGNPECLVQYANLVRRVCTAIENANMPEYYINPELFLRLIELLGDDMKQKWYIYRASQPIVDAKRFSLWLDSVVLALPAFGSSPPTVNLNENSSSLFMVSKPIDNKVELSGPKRTLHLKWCEGDHRTDFKPEVVELHNSTIHHTDAYELAHINSHNRQLEVDNKISNQTLNLLRTFPSFSTINCSIAETFALPIYASNNIPEISELDFRRCSLPAEHSFTVVGGKEVVISLNEVALEEQRMLHNSADFKSLRRSRTVRDWKDVVQPAAIFKSARVPVYKRPSVQSNSQLSNIIEEFSNMLCHRRCLKQQNPQFKTRKKIDMETRLEVSNSDKSFLHSYQLNKSVERDLQRKKIYNKFKTSFLQLQLRIRHRKEIFNPKGNFLKLDAENNNFTIVDENRKWFKGRD